MLLRRLGVGRLLQLLWWRLQPEQRGDPTQNRIVLLEAGDPLVEHGLVSAAGHAHGEDRTFIHWLERHRRAALAISSKGLDLLACWLKLELSKRLLLVKRHQVWVGKPTAVNVYRMHSGAFEGDQLLVADFQSI